MGIAFPGESPAYRAARDRLLEQEVELRRAIETRSFERCMKVYRQVDSLTTSPSRDRIVRCSWSDSRSTSSRRGSIAARPIS